MLFVIVFHSIWLILLSLNKKNMKTHKNNSNKNTSSRLTYFSIFKIIFALMIFIHGTLFYIYPNSMSEMFYTINSSPSEFIWKLMGITFLTKGKKN